MATLSPFYKVNTQNPEYKVTTKYLPIFLYKITQVRGKTRPTLHISSVFTYY